MKISRNIRNTFSRYNLIFVLFSFDTDSVFFVQAIKWYQINRHNIFKDRSVISLLGKTPITSTYQIGPSGRFGYSSWD